MSAPVETALPESVRPTLPDPPPPSPLLGWAILVFVLLVVGGLCWLFVWVTGEG